MAEILKDLFLVCGGALISFWVIVYFLAGLWLFSCMHNEEEE